MKTANLLRHADVDTWRAFHAHWGWSTSRRDVTTPAVAVPSMLVAFHAVVRRVQVNELTPLSRLKARDGFVCIYDEAQGTFEWGPARDRARR
jgi:hypothetical protein